MEGVQNYMEVLVEEEVDGILVSVGGCKCEKCRKDVCAIALNHLKPMYVVSTRGKILTKLNTTSLQYKADILSALTYAATIVAANTKHEEDV